MKVLLNLCLLFSLISPVLLLTCHKCSNATGTECTKTESQKCQSTNPNCRSLIFRSNMFLNNEQVHKFCMPNDRCHPGHFSVTTSGGGFLEMLVECCNKNNCNSKNLKFSSEPMKTTGVECVGCQSEVKNQERCHGTEVVTCRGDQTKCISLKIDYQKRSKRVKRDTTLTIKGCATPEMCDGRKLTSNFLLKEVMIERVTVNCTDPI